MITIDVTITAGSYADAQRARTRLIDRLSQAATISAPYQGGGLHGEAGWQIAVRLGDATDLAWATDVDRLFGECRQLLDQVLVQ